MVTWPKVRPILAAMKRKVLVCMTLAVCLNEMVSTVSPMFKVVMGDWARKAVNHPLLFY